MECSYFGQCGSCTLFAQSYDEQVERKLQRVGGLLSHFYTENLRVYRGEDTHYRSRAEFRIWHTGDRCDYAMGNWTKDGSVTIAECPKVSQLIYDLMPSLLEAINSSEVLCRRLFAVEFLATTTDEVLVTLIYHRKLDEAWKVEAKALEEALNIHIIGRSRKQKVVLSQDFVTETLQIGGTPFYYRYYEGGFTQPNPAVNTEMLTWAVEQAKMIGGGDLLELYCGLGNFTIPLSRHFDQVLATEVSKNSIRAAQENVALNGTDNITFVRMSSEEMVEAFAGVRPFRRLEQAGVTLSSYDFSTVFVDPPRAGLDATTTQLVSGFEHILYVSCNPETLARDLQTLSQTHDVLTGAIFDQFPHTEHVESGVVLRRR